MASLNPAAAPDGHLHLLGLPAELQAMIFDFAYQRHPETKLISATDWRRERSSTRQGAGDWDFCPDANQRFEPKVSDFLVSKQYFVSAARSWVASQAIDINPYSRPNFQRTFTSILAAFARDVVGDYVMCGIWKLASVRTLRLSIKLLAFEVDEEDEVELPVLKRRLTEQEFAGSSVAGMFDHVRGAKRFELTADELQGYFTDEQKANWIANVKTLEEVVRGKVTATQPKAEPSAIPEEFRSPEWTPLYPESDVFWESAKEREAVKSNVDASILEFIVLKLADMAGKEQSQVEKMVGDLLANRLPETRACDDGATQVVLRKLTPMADPTCDKLGFQKPPSSLTKGDGKSDPHRDAPDATDYKSLEAALAVLDQKMAEERRELAELKLKMAKDYAELKESAEIISTSIVQVAPGVLVEKLPRLSVEEGPETNMQQEKVLPSTRKKIHHATWASTTKVLIVGLQIVLILGWCLQWYRYRRVVDYCWQYGCWAV